MKIFLRIYFYQPKMLEIVRKKSINLFMGIKMHIGLILTKSPSESGFKTFKNSRVHVYGNDLNARGIQDGQIKDGLTVFEHYDNLVMDIMENFDQVVSF
jgi:tRNA 2-thiouridine synthesizing protein B